MAKSFIAHGQFLLRALTIIAVHKSIHLLQISLGLNMYNMRLSLPPSPLRHSLPLLSPSFRFIPSPSLSLPLSSSLSLIQRRRVGYTCAPVQSLAPASRVLRFPHRGPPPEGGVAGRAPGAIAEAALVTSSGPPRSTPATATCFKISGELPINLGIPLLEIKNLLVRIDRTCTCLPTDSPT